MDCVQAVLIALARTAQLQGHKVIATAHPDGYVDLQLVDERGHLVQGYQLLASGEMRGPYQPSICS